MSVSSLTRAVIGGVVAGAAGTAAMDLLLYARYRRGGGDQDPLAWETARGVDDWQRAPAPARVAQKIAAMAGIELPSDAVRTTTNVMHWSYGTGWGSLLGLGQAMGMRAGIFRGIVFGSLVWAFDYAVLPPMGIYQPAWEYGAETLWKDLSAHMLYGAVAGGVAENLAD
jgi:hypothetical protein